MASSRMNDMAKEGEILPKEARRMGESMIDYAEEKLEDTREQLRSVARDTGARVQQYITHKRDQIQDARQSAERTIRTNPLTATAVAFAGGMLMAAFLRRK